MEQREACLWLGVNEGATAAQVRRAFRSIAQASHPDHGGSSAAFVGALIARDELLKTAPSDLKSSTDPAPAQPTAPSPYDAWLRPVRAPSFSKFDSERLTASPRTFKPSPKTDFAAVLAQAQAAFAA